MESVLRRAGIAALERCRDPPEVTSHRAKGRTRLKLLDICATGGMEVGDGAEGLPDEVGAMAAESRLLEEPGDEFVVLHFVDVLLPQSAFSSKPVRYVRGGRLVKTCICHRVPPLSLYI